MNILRNILEQPKHITFFINMINLLELSWGARGRRFPACLPSAGKPAGKESVITNIKESKLQLGLFQY
jgi:hypothetical protein